MTNLFSFHRARRTLLVAFLAMILLPAAQCGQPPIQGSGSSANIQVVPGSGGNWSAGQFSPPYGPITGPLLNMINGHRLSIGLHALIFHDGMTVAATVHSADMSNQQYLSIVSPQGVDVYERMVSSNPRIDFDNAFAFVGYNGTDAAAIYTALYSMPAGRYVIENPQLTHFGAKTTLAGGAPVQYWTVVFALNARP